MPGFAHFLLSSLFALLLYNLNSKRFTRKHAMIFVLIAFTGPDMTGNFGGFSYLLGHSVLGWPLYALILTPIIAFMTRFHFDVRHFQLIDDGSNSPTRLSWWRSYLVTTASGIFHFTVDLMVESKSIWNFPTQWRENAVTLMEYYNFSTSYYNSFSWVLIVLGVLLLFGLFKLLQQADSTGNTHRVNLWVGGITVMTFITLFITGVQGEQDLGVMVFIGGFVILPMFLCITATFPENHQPVEKNYDNTRAEFKLKIVCIVFWILTVALMLTAIIFSLYYSVGFVGLLEPGRTVDMIYENFYTLLIAVILLIILFAITGILLFKHSVMGQRLAHIFLPLTSLFVLPLILWALIREEEVSKLFLKK